MIEILLLVIIGLMAYTIWGLMNRVSALESKLSEIKKLASPPPPKMKASSPPPDPRRKLKRKYYE